MMKTTDSNSGTKVNQKGSKPFSPSGKNFSDSSKVDTNEPGFANESEPAWAPPEHRPEPMPSEPILDNPSQSNQST
jgi:hypothetical protein